MEDNNFKEFAKRASVWTAPTGLPIIAGAAYSVGKVMVGFSFSIMSLFCSFFGLPVEAKNFCDKQANAIYKDPFDGIKYGFDSTAQFFGGALSKVFPNGTANLPASAAPAPKEEAALPKVEKAADVKPKEEELDDAAEWQDPAYQQWQDSVQNNHSGNGDLGR